MSASSARLMRFRGAGPARVCVRRDHSVALSKLRPGLRACGPSFFPDRAADKGKDFLLNDIARATAGTKHCCQRQEVQNINGTYIKNALLFLGRLVGPLNGMVTNPQHMCSPSISYLLEYFERIVF